MNQAKPFFSEGRGAPGKVQEHRGECRPLRADMESIDDPKQKSPNDEFIWAFPVDIWSG